MNNFKISASGTDIRAIYVAIKDLIKDIDDLERGIINIRGMQLIRMDSSNIKKDDRYSVKLLHDEYEKKEKELIELFDIIVVEK